MVNQTAAVRPREHQKLTLYITLGSSAVIIGLIALSQGEERILAQNITLIVTSASAFVFSVLSARIVAPIYRRAFIAFAIGLGLWCAAEISWAYYVQILDVDVPFPSATDGFYLAGYFFVGYFLVRIVRRIINTNQRNVLVISTISVSIVASIINIFILDLVRQSFTITSLPLEDSIALILSIAYPIFDGLLLIPSMIILYESRRNSAQHFSWILLSIGMLLLGIGDTGFGYTALRNVEALADEAIWDVIFALSYVFVTCCLLHEYVTANDKKALK